MLSVAKPAALPPRYVGPGKLIAPGSGIIKTKKALKDAGFEVLGMGAHQVALAKPRGRRVVKFAAGYATGAWSAIEMFKAHPEIDEFPRIFGVAELRGGVWAVEMERLVPDGNGGQGWEIDGEMDSGAWEDVADIWGHHIANAFEEHWDGFIDLHHQNWMLRGDTPVIIDPFNSWDGIDEPATARALTTLGTRRGSYRGSPETFWRGIH
ncbi:hypothetical protein [Sphingopyxis flava]|uniref:Uncharacterized protein n=1 Tax=Sphingopyxis flava TaxID=1507287 RepID=A0A1T5BS66_9SPHN|nr:hypothetical protein [Sphingopyxis flava]SKB50014.1 hypothetical protein SAMN06295937_100794 [Sphingopyxis flava]